MPKEGVPNIIEIVNLISIILKFYCLLDGSFHNFSREDSPLKVDCVSDVDFTIIDEIVSTYEVFDSLLK